MLILVYLQELPEKLAGTLEHIVGQLDIITKTVEVGRLVVPTGRAVWQVMEERLTANEDRLAHMHRVQNKIIEQLDLRV